MTETELIRKPSAARVALFYGGFLAAVVAPLAIGAALLLLGPKPWLLDREALPPAPATGTVDAEDARVRVLVYETVDEAKAEQERIRSTTPTRTATTVPGSWRYQRSDDRRRGELLRFDDVLLHAEGTDREAVQAALTSLPFLEPNPKQSPLLVLFEEHLPRFFWGLGAYVLLVFVGMCKGAPWAGRITPPPGVSPVSSQEMRERLLAIGELDAPLTVEEKRGGDLTVTWRIADTRWRTPMRRSGIRVVRTMTLRLAPRRHAVRSVTTQRKASWTGGLLGGRWSLAAFRGLELARWESASAYGLRWEGDGWSLDEAYRYRFSKEELEQPVLAAILSGGWSYRPGLFLSKVLS